MLKVFLIILMYYPLSVGLTFYQKWFLKSFRFPLLIVSGHYLIKLFIALSIRFILEFWQNNRRVRIPLKDQLKWIMPIGVCASLDIGLSNWALEYVTVSLYTMAKSSSILFIVAFSLFLKLERWRPSLGFNAALIAFGLFLFTWRSTQLDMRGLLLVELAAMCTGVRWTISQLIMQGDDQPSPLRHPLDMIIAVQPWMFLAIFPMVIVIEESDFTLHSLTYFDNSFQPWLILLFIFCGGILAFLMEMSEYLLLVNTSGITLSLLGIVKEVVTLLLAHYIHGDRLTSINIVGLSLCILGMLTHSLAKNNRKESLIKMRMSGVSPQLSCCPSPALPRSLNTASLSSALRTPFIGTNLETEDRRKLLCSGDEKN